MISPELKSALARLSTGRLQRLVDRIEAEPDIELTVRGWYPQCPMVAAGFSPSRDGAGPECRFAAEWDRCARAEPHWWHAFFPLPYRACRSDVRGLLRAANTVLAARDARVAAAASDTGRREQATGTNFSIPPGFMEPRRTRRDRG